MLINIAICDDNMEELTCLRQYAGRYFCAENTDVQEEIDTFSHPDALLNSCRRKKYQLFLLDILMPMLNGIQTAKEIEEENPSAFFVFCTSSSDFPFEAYSLNTIHYLVKPVSYPDFQAAMERFLLRLGAAVQKSIRIPDRNGNVTECVARDLLYIDVSGKNCILHTMGGTAILRNSIRNLSEKLRDCPMLFAAGSTYIINMENVRMVNGAAVTMADREVIFLPVKLAGPFKKQYLEYFNR